MAGSDDTAVLDFGGNFPEGASESIAAADQLAAAMVKLQDASERVKDPKFAQAAKFEAITAELNQQAAIQAKIATFDANRVRALAQQEATLKKMKEDALGITAANERAAQQKIHDANEASASNAGQLATAAGAAMAAGMVILHAAEKLASAAFELGKAGVALAISETTKGEVQGKILDKLTGGKGGEAMEMATKVALDVGIDDDVAIEKVKKLLNAGFKNEEIPLLIKTKVGMDAAGLDGDALLKKLETIKLGSKIGTKDVEGLKKLGIDVGEVYKAIAAKTGESMDVVKAKVKAGTADADQVVKAIEKVAGGKFGSIAETMGNSIPGLLMKLQVLGKDLFQYDPATLEPIKSALKAVADVMAGPAGAELKKGLGEIFTAFTGLFKGITKDDITVFFKEAAKDAHKMADALVMAGPAIKDFARGMGMLSIAGMEAFSDAMLGAAYWARELDNAIKDPAAAFSALDDAAANAAANLVEGFGQAVADLATQAEEAGMNMVRGIAEGILGAEAEAINAAVQMATNALDAAKAVLGIKSPSEEFAEVGGYSAEGMAEGMAGHSGPAEAGKKMAGAALEGAASVAGGAGGVGAAAGGRGGGDTFNVNIHAGGGGGAEAQWHAMLPEIERDLRRIVRDAREGANS